MRILGEIIRVLNKNTEFQSFLESIKPEIVKNDVIYGNKSVVISYFENVGLINFHNVSEINVSKIKQSSNGTNFRTIKLDNKTINIYFNDESNCLMTLEP